MVAPYEVGEPVRSFVRVPTKDQAARTLCWDLSRASSVVASSAPVRHLLQAQPQSAQLQDSAGSSPKPSKEQLQAQPQPVEPQPQPVEPQPQPGETQLQPGEPQPKPGEPQPKLQPGEPQAQAQPGEPQAQAQPVEHQTQSQPVESLAQSVVLQAQTTAPAPQPAASRCQQVTVTRCEPKRPREEEEEGGEVSMPQPVLKVARTAGFTDTSSSAQPPQCLDKEVQSLRQQCQLLQQQNSDLQRRLNLFHGLFQDKQRLKSFVRHLDTLVK